MVEAKSGADSLSPSLHYFQKQLKIPYAFQVALNADFVKADCFATSGRPIIFPAKTFLSQLL
jgi:hypothetical protein